MAVGDVVSNVVSVAGSNTLVFQPAAGVEILLFIAGGASANVALYNGTNVLEIADATIGDFGAGIGITTQFGTSFASMSSKLPINNTNYLYILNGSINPKVLGYSGIQIK